MKIISGGQTGADQGGLDAAIELEKQGYPVTHGGYCPKGRKSEKGPIPDIYKLEETDSDDYVVRTNLNVKAAHTTVIIHQGVQGPGTKRTLAAISFQKKGGIVIDLRSKDAAPLLAGYLKGGLEQHGENFTLNIAGPRESKSPGIQKATRDFLIKVLTTKVSDYPPVLEKRGN